MRKIYVKTSQNWKNVKTSKKFFFMNFRDIFMWVIVVKNTFSGSVLDTISWSETHVARSPIILDLPQIYSFFRGTFDLQSIFLHLWSTRVDLNFCVQKSPNLPMDNANLQIFISYMAPEIFSFSCTDTPRPDLKITTFTCLPVW